MTDSTTKSRKRIENVLQVCAKKLLLAAPEILEVVIAKAKKKNNWACKYLLDKLDLAGAIEDYARELAEREEAGAFISSAFERRLIEDLRRAGKLEAPKDESETESKE